jgi:RimJ/RimL family protein N-acetyltransferase
MKIEFDGIILRKWQASDAERLAEIANNKKIYDNLRDAFPHPYNTDDAKAYISVVGQDNELSKVFAIETDGVIVGSIGAFLKEDVYRKNAEIGYYISEDYWGKGIATKAIKAIAQHIFDNYDVIRIYAEPFARNMGSRKVLEKSGFRLEATLKNNVIKNEVIEDSCIYSILKEI